MAADKAPTGLSARSRRLWAAVLTEFELSPAERELLRGALEALDRADEAAKVVKAEGVTVTDRYGTPKAHPATDVESRNRALFARMVAQLGIKAEAPPIRLVGAKRGPKQRVGVRRAS